MKIGILTHPLRFNYGGILQNYALQHVLRSYGHEVYTIDWNDDKSYIYMLLSYVKRLFLHYILRKKYIPTNFYINLTRKQFLKINKKNQIFIEKNICRTDYLSSKSALTKVNEMNFDVIVVGSDQVWLEQFVPTMYLDFIKKNIFCITYAASFGKSEWTYSKKNTDIAKLLVKNFSAISVREDSAVELCKKYLGVSATLVLDPTLLLTKDVYNEVIDTSEDLSPKYEHIMTYILDKSLSKTKFVNKVKEILDLNVYEISVRSNEATLKQSVYSVSTWLSGFKNASFIITDSFHGMVFSILYNKQFLVFVNKKRGLARFTSLLDKLELLDRLIFLDEDNIDQISKRMKTIDYSKVNLLLEKEKKISYGFIEKSLKK